MDLSRVVFEGLCILLISAGFIVSAPAPVFADSASPSGWGAFGAPPTASANEQVADAGTLDLGMEEEETDPLEDFNRLMFGFNEMIDTLLLRPAAEFYTKVLPPPFQRGIRNFLRNLRTPVILVNDLLQGEVDRAGTTLTRFLINTTIGIGGFSDQAGKMGFFYHNEDFGQTFAVWGVGDGPYLMLPILGPSNPRDLVGTVVEFLVDPINIWANNADEDWVIPTRVGLTGVERRAAALDFLDEAKKSSLDYYTTIRSLYQQHRKDEVDNGEDGRDRPAPGFSYDLSKPGQNQASGK